MYWAFQKIPDIRSSLRSRIQDVHNIEGIVVPQHSFVNLLGFFLHFFFKLYWLKGQYFLTCFKVPSLYSHRKCCIFSLRKLLKPHTHSLPPFGASGFWLFFKSHSRLDILFTRENKINNKKWKSGNPCRCSSLKGCVKCEANATPLRPVVAFCARQSFGSRCCFPFPPAFHLIPRALLLLLSVPDCCHTCDQEERRCYFPCLPPSSRSAWIPPSSVRFFETRSISE